MLPIPIWAIGDSRTMEAATIAAVTIDGDRLIVTTQYAGTGKHHDIGLLRDRQFIDSSPPQLNLYLTHTSNDSGGKPMREDVHFDLRPIKEACLLQFKNAKALVLRIHDSTNDEVFVPLPRYPLTGG